MTDPDVEWTRERGAAIQRRRRQGPSPPGPWSGWGLRLLLLALLPAALFLRWKAESAPATVERLFSERAYPAVATVLGCLSSRVPFSLGELGLGLVLVWVAYRGARHLLRWRRGDLGILGAGLAFVGDLAALGSAGFLAFLLLWGLNYQREPFAVLAHLDARPAPTSELELLSVELVEATNVLREGLPEDGQGVLRLPRGLRATLDRTRLGFEQAASRYPVLAGRCGRPKPLVGSALFSRLGLAGIFSPFTGEPNVNVGLPAPDIPFGAAHEMAHQRGFAREDEANYLGYLACRLHPDPEFRYSGVLAASRYVQAALARVDRDAARRIEARRSPAVLRDTRALAEWAARYRGPLVHVSEEVNDAYLKAQGQAGGVASYGRMVDLLLAERRAHKAGS